MYAWLGVVQTPGGVAKILARWALRNRSDVSVEPSCGEGAILDAMLARLAEFDTLDSTPVHITGIELSGRYALRTKHRLEEKYGIPIDVRSTGYFSYLAERDAEEVDAIVGNPPFLRSAEMPRDERETALSLLEQWGWSPSRGMNSWAYFLLASLSLLRTGGRVAMVVPSELLQADYARVVRRALACEFGQVLVVLIRGNVFPEVDQNAVLVLGQKGGPPKLEFITASSGDLLRGVFEETSLAMPDVSSSGRWDANLLPARARSVMREVDQVEGTIAFGECANVDVGVVTGQNSFFLLTNAETRMLAARRVTRRVLGRTRYLKGLSLSSGEWKVIEEESPSNLLVIGPNTHLSAQLEAYLAEGEISGIPLQHKCGRRKLWYSVPSTWVPDAFLSRQFGTYPRLCLNEVKATCTDTILRVCFEPGLAQESVAARFINSLTFAHAELVGRRYGGGVLELMPRDAEQLRLPEPGFVVPSSIWSELDRCLRARQVEEALDIGDQLFLREQLGMPRTRLREYRRAWHRLRDWRLRTNN